MNIEYKHTTLAHARVKASDSGEPIITGYASVFGNVDSYEDIVQKGAFSRSLKRDGPTRVTLWQHDSAEPIGVGTFKEDEYGLLGEYRFVNGVQRSAEALSLIRASVIFGISIGYMVPDDGFIFKGRNRLLIHIDLMETSFVTFAANTLARVTDTGAEKALRALAGKNAALAVDQAFARIRREMRK